MNDVAGGVLVVGPSWVGDMVMSQVLYACLQQTRPGVKIDVLAPAWSEPLLQRMPEVRDAIVMPVEHGEVALGRRWRLGRALRSRCYQQAVILPNSFKSALVPLFAGIPQRTGWRGEMRYGVVNDLRQLDDKALPLMVQRFAALAYPQRAALPERLPAPRLVVRDQRVAECLDAVGLRRDQPLLALCPGAEFGGAKRWPVDAYAELALRYLGRGWQVALFGSEKDRPVSSAILQRCEGHSGCIDLAGRTRLDEAVDLLAGATAVVSNDSGLMHIAAALARPMVAIYGPTSPGFTPPLGGHSTVLASDIECAPCFQRECPLSHHRCMLDTTPEQVDESIQELLERGPDG